MGTSILGDILVRYKADISDLSEKITQAKSKMSEVGDTAQKSGSSIFSGFKNGVAGALDFGAKVGQTVIGMKGLADGAIGLASALLEPNASMEQTTVAFETLLGKGQKTQDFLTQLKQFAAATPFTFPELATDAEHMLAFGFSAKDVIPYLTNIGDAMGAMGKGTAEIDQIVTVFGQMHAAGKLNAQDMDQIVSQGIPAWKYLADAMHKTVPEVQDLSSKGLIPADKAIQAVSDGMHKMFGGGMAAQANTFNGLLSTLQDNAGAAMRAFTGPLFDKAKTGLTELGNLVSSKQFQDFATGAGAALGTAFTDIGNVIGPIVTNFASFVNWLEQGSAPAVVVGTALAMIAGGFAAIQIGAFVAAVPALVAGFIAWAAAAWTAAIGTIAATWPLFAIGAAVVLVVAIIIIAVKNWGAISAWLVGAWKSAIGWLGGAMNSIGGFFTSVWNGIKAGTTSAWNFLVNIVKQGAKFLLDTITAPFRAIGALFQWLYNHNVYFKQLIDSITGIVKAGMAWLQGAFHTALQWIIDKIMWFVDLNKAEFNMIYNAIKSALTSVYNFVVSIVSTILGFFSQQWNQAVQLVTQLWQKISGIFSSAWSTYVSGPLGKIRQGIIDWFSNLGNSALNAGKNFINMLVNGIKSGAGAIWDAVTGIASNIWKALGFHSPPPDGPARDSDRWMPNFIKMLSSGLTAGAPQVKTASQYVAAQMVYPIKPSANSIVVAGGGTLAGGSAGQGQTFILEVDGHELAKIVNVSTDRKVRLKMGAHGRAA